MPEKPIRLGIVGLKQGLEDVYVALHHEGFDLVAVCDREPEPFDWITGRARFEDSEHEYAYHARHLDRMMATVRAHPDVSRIACFDDYETMLRDADLDAVSLMVPDALHAPFAKAALEAGKWVSAPSPWPTRSAPPAPSCKPPKPMTTATSCPCRSPTARSPSGSANWFTVARSASRG